MYLTSIFFNKSTGKFNDFFARDVQNNKIHSLYKRWSFLLRIALVNGQLRSFLQNCSHLLKKYLREYYIFCAMATKMQSIISTAQKMKFTIEDFFSKSDQIRSFLQFFLSGFFFTNIHDSQDSREKGRVSI